MAQETQYKQYPYRLTSKGCVARFANDSQPDHAFATLQNMEVRQENAISTRFGRIPLTVNSGNTANQPLAGPVETLGRLKGLMGNVWRYASAGGNLYRIAGNAPGVWASIATGLSLGRCSMVTFTPPFSSTPYEYIADGNVMLEDGGTGTPGTWGILWPTVPMSAVVVDGAGVVEAFLNDGNYTYTNVASHSTITPISTTAPGLIKDDSFIELTPVSTTGMAMGQFISYFTDAPQTTGLIQYIDANTPPDIFFESQQGLSWNNQVPLIRYGVEVVTGGSGDALISRTLPNPWNLQPLIDAGTPQLIIRVTVHNPSDLGQMIFKMSSNDGTYASGYSYNIPGGNFGTDTESVILIPLSSLTPYGTSPSLVNIVAFTIFLQVGGAVTADFFSINLDFGQGPSILGGTEYDYLYTYFNANTGEESGPSPLMLDGAFFNYHPVSMFYGPVFLQWINSPDSRVTHTRIYRRGGTLTAEDSWNLIAEQPFPINSMYDNMTDGQASTGSLINIDNYPPITSTLPVSVNTTVVSIDIGAERVYVASVANISLNQRLTIGTGTTQETVTVLGLGSNYFEAFTILPHKPGETVYGPAAWAQSANLAQVGFDMIFVAGDPNNPGRLYYSNNGAPSCFGVENYIDLDDPTDPIMGITPAAFGRMYVFTLGASVYQVYSVGGSTPVAMKTNATHGMFSQMAFVMMDAGVPYLSNDGIYLFNSATSVEVSQFVQWVFREYQEANGPIPVMDLTKRNQVCFGFYYDEVFVGYPAVDGLTYRLIYSARDNRWRNDTIPALSMNYEKDIATLIYGDATGMVYQDRTGDTDYSAPGVTAPIEFVLATAALDQGFPKNPKVYQEVTIDINTNGQDVDVQLVLDNLTDQVDLGSVNTASRQQINLTVASGDGLSSLNAGLRLSGFATETVDIFELHFKALVNTELRLDFDTWITDYGTNGWKTAKQAYWQYVATVPIIISVYLDGNTASPSAVPDFTITLPSTNGNRVSIWTRFPAHKAQLYRFVGVSSDGISTFQIYESSYVEVKPLCGAKGYAPKPLAMGGS